MPVTVQPAKCLGRKDWIAGPRRLQQQHSAAG
jgi:hypothetical protein